MISIDAECDGCDDYATGGEAEHSANSGDDDESKHDVECGSNGQNDKALSGGYSGIRTSIEAILLGSAGAILKQGAAAQRS